MVDAALVSLGSVRQKGGKVVHAYAVAADTPAGWVALSNTFRLEWPPRSGRYADIPEVDRAEWFALEAARVKLNPAQVALLDRLVTLHDA